MCVASASVALVLGAYLGCAASEGRSGPTNDGGSSTTGVGAQDGAGTGGAGGGGVAQGGDSSSGEGGSGGLNLAVGSGGGGGGMACAEFTIETELDPAAMVVVLDRSPSMLGSKWFAAKDAVVKAIDKNVFDSMSIGLVAFPDTFVPPPQCICDYAIAQAEAMVPGICSTIDCCFGLPSVSCGVPVAMHVPVQLVGPNKSFQQPGVRYDIDQFVDGQEPFDNMDDGSPIYDTMVVGYEALKSFPNVDERMLVLVTDGGFSCTSLSSREGYTDDIGCADWEKPENVVALIDGEYNDASTPVRTFVVGVPGSDSNGEMQGSYATPPYSMRLALSTYAYTGSPDTVDPACDWDAPLEIPGSDPATPCHIDMTTSTFDADALAAVIAELRGNALGCVYPLPEPPMSQTIDLEKVNVKLTLAAMTSTLPKRSDPNDECENDGCWDYLGSDNDIELIGKACDDVSTTDDAKVEIEAGCATIVK